MADTWTTPDPNLEIVTDEIVTAPKMNQGWRDDLDVLARAVDGDSSTTTIKHRHNNGLAGTAPPATGEAGRLYGPQGQILIDDGAAWWTIGAGPFDDFNREDSAAITPAASGHPWTEESGTWNIVSTTLKLTAGSGYATLDTRTLLNRNYVIDALLLSGGTQGAIDMAVVVRYKDSNNIVYVQLTGNALQVVKIVNGGAAQPVNTVSVTPAANTGYWFHINVFRSIVSATVTQAYSASPARYTCHSQDDELVMAGSTKVGVRIVNTQDACRGIDVHF